jgi:hypothetical protein
MRRRGRESWELRVYAGIDPDTSRQQWLTKTVHGSARYARGQLAELAAEAGRAKLRAGTLSDLLGCTLVLTAPSHEPTGRTSMRTVSG